MAAHHHQRSASGTSHSASVGIGGAAGGSAGQQTYFEQQRAELVKEIALSLDQVLQNINRLNRNLESIITVGNEFSSVEALWSQFETVMGRQKEDDEAEGEGAADDAEYDEDEEEHDGEDDEERETEEMQDDGRGRRRGDAKRDAKGS